jgi:hypothetical protein
VPYSNGAHFGKLVRISLSDFSAGGVSVVDLTTVDSALKGVRGCFTSGDYGYLVPSHNGAAFGKLTRIKLASCASCAAGTFKAVTGAGSCLDCPVLATSSTAAANCSCVDGFAWSAAQQSCTFKQQQQTPLLAVTCNATTQKVAWNGQAWDCLDVHEGVQQVTINGVLTDLRFLKNNLTADVALMRNELMLMRNNMTIANNDNPFIRRTELISVRNDLTSVHTAVTIGRNDLSSMRNNLTILLSDLSSRLDSQDVALRSLSWALAAMSLVLAVIFVGAIQLAARLKQSSQGSVCKERQLGDQELVEQTL